MGCKIQNDQDFNSFLRELSYDKGSMIIRGGLLAYCTVGLFAKTLCTQRSKLQPIPQDSLSSDSLQYEHDQDCNLRTQKRSAPDQLQHPDRCRLLMRYFRHSAALILGTKCFENPCLSNRDAQHFFCYNDESYVHLADSCNLSHY